VPRRYVTHARTHAERPDIAFGQTLVEAGVGVSGGHSRHAGGLVEVIVDPQPGDVLRRLVPQSVEPHHLV